MTTLDLLTAHKPAFEATLTRYGVHSPRVFAALGDDTPDSGIDLLVTKTTAMSYGTIARMRAEVSAALGRRVDIVFDDRRRPGVAEGVRENVKEIS